MEQKPLFQEIGETSNTTKKDPVLQENNGGILSELTQDTKIYPEQPITIPTPETPQPVEQVNSVGHPGGVSETREESISPDSVQAFRQDELGLPEPEESDQEITARLAEIHKRDNLIRHGFRRLRAQTYLQSALLFGREILGMPIKKSYHGEIFQRLDNFKKHHLWLGPRASLKTSAMVAKALHWAIKDPNESILIYGETNKNSLRSLRTIKGICENNEKFINTFGVMGFTGGPTKWTDEELYFMGRRRGTTERDPTFSAGGLDVAMTGGHFTKIICDDLVSDKNTQNSEQIEKSYETWLTLFPLLRPGGQMWVMGTYWDMFDLYNVIQERHKDEFMIYNRGGFGDPGVYDGEAILPELGLTKEFLLSQLNRPGNRARACMWYFGVCVDEEKQPFKDQDKKTWDPITEKPPETLSICISIDPASSIEDNACDTAIIVAGMDEQSRLWELEHRNGRWSPKDTIENIFELQSKWSPNAIGIESGGFFNFLKPWLDIEMGKRGCFMNLVPLDGWQQKSKQDRIMGLQPRWVSGALILRADSQDIMSQFYNFPKRKKRDLIDAFAYQEEMQSAPLIPKQIGVYYDKNKYPNLTDTDRLIYSRYDPEIQAELEQQEQDRIDAMC